MIEKDKARAKRIGLKLKQELEKLAKLIPLDTEHDQMDGCGTAGCFGAKLAVLYREEINRRDGGSVDDVYYHEEGADALARELGFESRVQMLDYLYYWWPNWDASGAFGGGYYAYEGYPEDYKGVWQAWMDCANNMIEGRQLR